MKRYQFLAVFVVAILLLAAVPVQQSRAAGSYSEKLSVFVAGSNALWYLTLTGVNGSSKLSSFESSAGLSWYNVTAIRTTTWQSDFQVYGPQGYNLLPVPFLPSEGLFLTLGSDSYRDALSAANALDSYLLSSFVSLSNGTNSFAFYSPLSFSDVIPVTLLSLLPPVTGGFAKAINPSSFDSTLSPFVVLEGQKSSSAFNHSIVVGSITNKALDTSGRPTILKYFGSNASSLLASSLSSSSIVQVRFLDGIVYSKDSAAVSNDSAHFTGSYTLSLPAGKKVFRLNATVSQQPTHLLATRTVDRGVLRHGENVSVILSLANLSNSSTLANISLMDNWWQTGQFQGLFRLVSGNSTISVSSLLPGARSTPTYLLQYIGTRSGRVTIPAGTVRYSYSLSGTPFSGSAMPNPLQLSLGFDDAVLLAYVTPTGGFGKSVGASQSFRIVVKNVGTLAASGVVVAGQSIAGLTGDGGTASVVVTQSAQGLLGTNISRAYSATYSSPVNPNLVSTTNIVPDVFSHASMKLGFATIGVSAQVSPLADKGGGTNLTLGFATSNIGSANVSSFVAHTTLPSGLGCGIVSGTGLSCSSGQLTLSYSSLVPLDAHRTYMKVNVTVPLNYYFVPFSFVGATAGDNLSGRSNALALPTGLVLAKRFSPSQLFSGMTSKVTLAVVNSGPFAAYNANVSSVADSFDSLGPKAVPSASAHVIPPGGQLNATYSVTASSTFGNLTASSVLTRFFYGGRVFSLQGSGPAVTIYQPASVTITTSPSSPIEGRSFSIIVTIQNPAGVAIFNVLFTLPIPPGMSLSQLDRAVLANGVLTVRADSMAPHSTFNATVAAAASSLVTVPFDKAKLTFTYLGATVSGRIPSQGIAIGEDVTSRYVLPTALVFLALLATAFYVRRKAAPIVPASQR